MITPTSSRRMQASAASADVAVNTSKSPAQAASQTIRLASSSSTNRTLTLITRPRQLQARCGTPQLRPPQANDSQHRAGPNGNGRHAKPRRRRLVTSCAQAISTEQRSPGWALLRNTELLLDLAHLRKRA